MCQPIILLSLDQILLVNRRLLSCNGSVKPFLGQLVDQKIIALSKLITFNFIFIMLYALQRHKHVINAQYVGNVRSSLLSGLYYML